MVVNTHPGINREPAEQVLPEVQVAGNLVLVVVANGAGLGSREYVFIPSLAVDVLIVKTNGDAVA